MTRLVVASEDAPARRVVETVDPEAIASLLRPLGVDYHRVDVPPGAADLPDDAVLDALEAVLAPFREEDAWASVDVARLTPDHPDGQRLSRAFLEEHTHVEDEVRCMVAGRGAFLLRRSGKIVRLECEAGDLITLPAGLRHAFDAGPRPDFAAVRVLGAAAGWTPLPTGDPDAPSLYAAVST